METKNETNREENTNKRKYIEGPKTEDLSSLEDFISTIILKLLQYYSYYSIVENSLLNEKKISRNTIKTHLKQGKIPPESFDSYIRAFSKSERLTIKLDDEQDFADPKVMKKIMTIFSDNLLPIYRCYKMLTELPYSTISNAIKEWDSAKKLSERFWYLLNKCFEAFCTLNYIDVMFLIRFFRSDEVEKQMILTKMDGLETNYSSQIINKLMKGEGKLWIDAHKKYSSDLSKKSPAEQNWETLKNKLQKYTSVKVVDTGFNNELHQTIAVNGFFTLIWPRENETDTKFGVKEIEALIIFKYFLTEEARQELVDELYNGQSEN